MGDSRWWFVMRLPREVAPGTGDWFQVQLLNDDGTSHATVNFTCGARDVHLAGREVPIPVLEAAEQRKLGDGLYVDCSGRDVMPVPSLGRKHFNTN
jgi:hypothetical protein